LLSYLHEQIQERSGLHGWKQGFIEGIACSSGKTISTFNSISRFQALFNTHRAEIVKSGRAENQSDCRIRYRAILEKIKPFIVCRKMMPATAS